MNDHVLKDVAISHGRFEWLTGKLSDVAGLIVFPLLLVACIDVMLRRFGGRRPLAARAQSLRRAVLIATIAGSAAAFAGIQLSSPIAAWYSTGMATTRWLPGAVAAVATGAEFPPVGTVDHVMDPADLIGLAGLTVSYGVGARWLAIGSRREPM